MSEVKEQEERRSNVRLAEELREAQAVRVQRDIEMMKDYLRGQSIVSIARKYALSEAAVYKVARRDRWRSHKDQIESKRLRDAAAEVQAELEAAERLSNAGIRLDEETGRYYSEHRVLSPAPTFGIIPGDLSVELISFEKGVRIYRTWLSPNAIEELRRGLGSAALPNDGNSGCDS